MAGRDFDDLARSVKNTIPALQKAQYAGVKKAALYTTTKIRTNIRLITGDMRLSGVGRSGARVGAEYNIKGGANPTAYIRGKGQLQLIEYNTAPHVIAGKKRRAKRRRVVAFGGRVYSRVNHPGTRGQYPFKRGWDASREEAPEIFKDEIGKAVRRTWGT